MRQTSFLFLFVTLGSTLAVCCLPVDHTEPQRPQIIHGWQEYKENGVLMQGSLLLKKGETTSNGKVAIKLLDIIPIDCSAEDSYRRPKAVFQIVDQAAQKEICTISYLEGEGRTLTNECENKNMLNDFYVLSVRGTP